MSKKEITDLLRARITEDLIQFLEEKYDTDVCRTAAGTLMIPAVDSVGDDRWVKLSIIIPKEASEEAGTDGYSLAHEYQLKLDAAAERKARREKESAEKAAKAAAREAAKKSKS